MEMQRDTVRHATAAARSTLSAGFSLLCLTISLSGLFMAPAGEPARLVIGLLALFFGQGFVAEFIGFRCDGGGVSFPRRPFPGVGFPTLWRRRISMRKISRADALGDRVILLYLNSAERVALVFPERAERVRFMRALSERLESRRQARPQAACRVAQGDRRN